MGSFASALERMDAKLWLGCCQCEALMPLQIADLGSSNVVSILVVCITSHSSTYTLGVRPPSILLAGDGCLGVVELCDVNTRIKRLHEQSYRNTARALGSMPWGGVALVTSCPGSTFRIAGDVPTQLRSLERGGRLRVKGYACVTVSASTGATERGER